MKIKISLDKYFFKLGIAFIVYLTIIISIFDFKPDLNEWLQEAGRNFILISSITMMYILIYSLSENLISKLPKPVFYVILSLLVSITGGTIGWQLNVLLFGFRVTHPFIFYIIIFLVTLFSAFAIHSYISYRNASTKLLRQEAEKQKLMKLKTDIELRLITAKINPHFLFNTLNSVMSLIPSNPGLAEEMLLKLSNLLRNVLDKNENDFTSIEKEIELTEEYLSIEKLRFGERLEYKIEMDNIVKDRSIPIMLLQPLVENSIRHGLSGIEGKGFIMISAKQFNNSGIKIEISDNGKGFSHLDDQTGFGLSSVRERLELIYGERQKFELDTSDGTKISITLMNGHNV